MAMIAIMATDHPRSRGGNAGVWVDELIHRGPSPLARGKRRMLRRRHEQMRTIPARAGETLCRSCTPSNCRDHPRSRGGNDLHQEPEARPRGPSPLARGKRRQPRWPCGDSGTIPARAGETGCLEWDVDHAWDHPRSRGGNLVLTRLHSRTQGPSPLARGKRGAREAWDLHQGTIPARAGETQTGCALAAHDGDHPRSRGGNESEPSYSAQQQGPSPLARGKLPRTRPCLNQPGTIPARAGETCGSRVRIAADGDHPRSRGGNALIPQGRVAVEGPSPLARGKHILRRQSATNRGTIPARAGETTALAIGMPCLRDHPRSRGGNSPVAFPPCAIRGPSPLARGKRACRPCGCMVCGTIPARAGETGSLGVARPARRDHPRSRGGNTTSMPSSKVILGPSPLARGKRP